MGRILLVGRLVLLLWGDLSNECGTSFLGRVLCGATCLGASCLWGELSVIL